MLELNVFFSAVILLICPKILKLLTQTVSTFINIDRCGIHACQLFRLMGIYTFGIWNKEFAQVLIRRSLHSMESFSVKIIQRGKLAFTLAQTAHKSGHIFLPLDFWKL